MEMESLPIVFNHKKNTKVIFTKEVKIGEITILEGAEGVIKFAGTELSYIDLKKKYPDKVQNITKYRIGKERIMPKFIPIEYSEKLFTTDKISPDLCFYDIFIPSVDSVTYNKLVKKLDLLLFRVPLKNQDSIIKKE